MAAEPGGTLSARREGPDLRPRLVLAVGLGTLGFVVAALASIWLFYAWMEIRTGFAPVRSFPAPQLQSDPAGDLRTYQAAQRARLEGYAWADREHGLVRIPIARAMAMIAGRGDAAYDPLDPPRWPDPRR